MIISEQAVRLACRREHEAILRCCLEWDQLGTCSRAVELDLARHSVVLAILREYLAREYHQGLHGR